MKMKIDKDKYRNEILVQSEVTVKGGKLYNIPCRLYLPEKIGDKPLVELKPTQKDFDRIARSHSFELTATVVGFDKLPKKIISFPEVYLLDNETRYWGPDLADATIIAEPQHLHIIDVLHGHTPQNKTSITFWISPNPYLSPAISSSIYFTGEIKQERVRQYKVTINNSLTLTFDKHFQYNANEEKELRQWANLVACTEISIAAADVDNIRDNILPEIDDFLLVVSLASKIRTVCLGWTASDGKSFTTYYRGNYTFPERDKLKKSDDGFHEGLIEIQDFEPFIVCAYDSFLAFENKLALRHAIYTLVPFKEDTIEQGFLRLFAGLETIVLDFRRKSKMEYVLPATEWIALKESLKKHIKAYHEFELNSFQRGSLYTKLDELNRISLREAFETFCVNYAVYTADLWPVFRSPDTVGLADIRNKLIHGDPLPDSLYDALIAAREHLRTVVERVMMRVLGWDIAKTKASPHYIEHSTYLIKDLSEAQASFNSYLAKE